MLMTEYDYQTDIDVQREEAEENGELKIKVKAIHKLHAIGWPLSEIVEFVELPENEVKRMIDSEVK